MSDSSHVTPSSDVARPTSAAERVERLADCRWASLREQRLDAGELHEGGRDLPVLRLAGLEPEVGAKRDGNERLELRGRGRSVGVLDDRRRRGVWLAVEREQGSPAPLACEPLRARPPPRSRG